ncbi:DUF1223 domain-containing protein [Ferruginibacter paludis]|uniref:DUF1223 domain-containing protein n=1 Tax=Ferruginibacter paludis TaxID=1310417 RepID=UPI0025B56BDC|nr:DUF1223 domain-containing protein [Ferruginibacter paludis]MDN3656698.1 DUF1223 domain-containing protein [Ferruginibacter paludis]
MKKLFLLSAIGSILLAAVAFRPQLQPKTSLQPVAVIELFTSQGCSSCPAADQLLAQTINASKKDGRKIFALSFHVDYWNRLGWADPFSTKEFSQRQRTYAAKLNDKSVYTPQMVVNGSRQFVGSDENDLKDALGKSLKTVPMAAFKTLTVNLQNDAPPQVKFSLEGNYEDCTINFALVSDSETTSVKRGENSGLSLTNENVVRQLITAPATAAGTINFKRAPVPADNNMRVIAYLQQSNSLKIIGAAMAEIK